MPVPGPETFARDPLATQDVARPADPAQPAAATAAADAPAAAPAAALPATRPKEYGGPDGPDPTRFGDWERRGRCIDF